MKFGPRKEVSLLMYPENARVIKQFPDMGLVRGTPKKDTFLIRTA